MSEMPVNRFWACLFSISLFALIWTQKMHKTRKWILITVLNYVITFTLLDMFSYGDYGDMVLGIVLIAVYGLQLIIHIRYMYRWTTEYNIANFGNKSQKDWLKENP